MCKFEHEIGTHNNTVPNHMPNEMIQYMPVVYVLEKIEIHEGKVIYDWLVTSGLSCAAMVVRVLIQKLSILGLTLSKYNICEISYQKIVWQVEWLKKARTTEILIVSLIGLAVL